MGDAAGYPSEGWVVWTFLTSLGENGFFSVLLSRAPASRRVGIRGPVYRAQVMRKDVPR